MSPQNFICTTIWLFCYACTLAVAQDFDLPLPDSSNRNPEPGRRSGPSDSAHTRPAGHAFWRSIDFTGGQLTLPFKIRPKADTHSFRLTTDVTVGAYVGLTKRLSAAKNISLTIPVAAGLTFINLNDNNTSLDLNLQEAEVVPGLTWSTGLILQLEEFSLGLVFGKDYASNVGDQWEYHRRMWWSFGIGFTFFH